MPLFADGSLIASPGLFLYGNDVVERNQTAREGFRKVWIDTSRLLVSGVLSRFFLFANGASRFRSAAETSITRIQIWRPASEMQSPDRPKYTLVWEKRVWLNTTTYGLLYKVIAEHCSAVVTSLLYTVSPKNDTDVTYYRFNPHQPISVIFGRDIAERVCY